MKKRNYLSALLVLLACGVFVTSCKDEFDEEQFLLQQQDRADKLAADEAAREDAEKAEEEAERQANIAALLEAGVNTSYTVNLHVDDVPVPNVAVSVTNQGGTTTTVNTDTSGNAAFTDLEVGSYNVAVSAADYLDFSYIVDFGTLEEDVHYEKLSDGTIVPIPNSEASKVELFALSGKQTATIKGKVEIETDLTNQLPEVPQNIQIRANLNAGFNASHSSRENQSPPNGSIFVDGSFTFTQGDIGVATVDNTTGEYTMQVPASEDGTSVQLQLPLIEADQTLAWTQVNGEDVGVQVGTQPAVFSPDIDAPATPAVNGVMAVFPEPPAPGRGFTINNFTPIYRGILEGEGLQSTINDFPQENDFNYLQFRGSNGSSDYQRTPIITTSAPTAPNVDLEFDSDLGETIEDTDYLVIEAWMDWSDFFYEITDGGEYDNGTTVRAYVTFTDDEGATQKVHIRDHFASNVTGQLTLGVFEPAFNGSVITEYNVTSVVFSLEPVGGVTTDATVENFEYGGEIEQFEIVNEGDGYNAIPTITVNNEGTGVTDPAWLEITEMAFEYQFDLDNSAVTQGYVVLPEIQYEYSNDPNNIVTGNDVDVLRLDADGFVIESINNIDGLENILRVSNGHLVFNDDEAFESNTIDGVRTPYSYDVPKGLIIEPEHEQASANLAIDPATGEVLDLIDIVTGSGYTEEFNVDIVSAIPGTGSGAEFELTGFLANAIIGEQSWVGGYVTLSGGEGYTTDINIASEQATHSPSVTIKNGETKIVNINYGTGDRVNDIE